MHGWNRLQCHWPSAAEGVSPAQPLVLESHEMKGCPTSRPVPARDRHPLPVWATAKILRRILGIDRRTLLKLGVRSIKLGTTPQSGRLFNVDHVRRKLGELEALRPTGPGPGTGREEP